MKATELMINNWVLYGTRYAIVKRIATDRCYILVSINKREELVEETYDNIDPILLTPEILEKNGFTIRGFYAESYIEDWQIISDGGCLAVRSECGWCIDIPCRYVHELQNVLCFCRIEKEITI